MKITLVAALTEKGVIGKNNALPWHIPEDLKHFRKVTEAKPVLMGRKTFESIGKPLPGRLNIVLSQDPGFIFEGVVVVHSIDMALDAAVPAEELMVIGGSKVFELCLPIASKMILSIIQTDYEGDTYFPKVEWSEWDLVSEEKRELFTIKIFDKKEKE